MGDRGNIVVRGSGSQVYLYTHWQGHEIPELARTALAKRQRWNDPQYLARIVFCTMVRGNEDRETGFGITSILADNSHPLLIIDCDKQQVFLEAEPENAYTNPGEGAHPLSFEQFATLEAASFGDLDPSRRSDADEAA